MGLRTTEVPSTNTIFIIFEPIILPITKFGSFFFIATRDVISSGKLVPRATTDREITIRGTPKKVAIPMTPEINNSAPYPSIIVPVRI